MIPGGLSLSGRSSNNSGNVLYSCLRRGSTDLYVYGRRVRWCNDDALLIDAGRPMALSAIPIRTWSALTTAVGEHKKGVLRWTSKHVFPLVLGAYGLFLIPVFLAAEEDANTYDGNSNKNENWILAMMYPLAAIIFAVGMVVVRLLLEETFHPAVRLVVDELAQEFLAAGYEVEYVVDRTGVLLFFFRRHQSLLRFVPVNDAADDVTAGSGGVGGEFL
jgi:hypothetical protein